MNKVAIFFFAFLIGCGKGVEIKDKLHQIDERVLPELDRFKEDYLYYKGEEFKFNLPVIIRFDDISTAGRCTVHWHGQRVITLNKRNWDRLIADQKYSLLLHELGHCIWHKNHSETGVMKKFIYSNLGESDFEEFFRSI